jgi:Ca2+-binding RTX toxin-like protein
MPSNYSAYGLQTINSSYYRSMFQDQVLWGTDGNDNLSGGWGNDHIAGGNGNDTLSGGYGNDTLYGGRGTDVLYGGAGSDSLDGGDDWDWIYSGDGNDGLSGGEGNDILYGEGGDDVINGGEHRDLIVGGTGRDLMFGGADSDLFVYQYGDSFAYTNSADVIIDWQGDRLISSAGSGYTEFEANVGSIEHAAWLANHFDDAGYFAAGTGNVYIYNATTDIGYLLMDLDNDSTFESGVVVVGANLSEFALL